MPSVTLFTEGRSRDGREAAALKRKAWTQEELSKLTMEQVERLLNDHQRLFVHEYLHDLNGTKAAVRAGYSEKNASSTASKLLRRPEIAGYRDRLVREKFLAVGITEDFVKLECFEVYKRCMAKEEVLEWNSGSRSWEPSGIWQFDAKGALRALDQMATLMGMKRPEDANTPENGETVEQYLNRTGGNQRQF